MVVPSGMFIEIINPVEPDVKWPNVASDMLTFAWSLRVMGHISEGIMFGTSKL